MVGEPVKLLYPGVLVLYTLASCIWWDLLCVAGEHHGRIRIA
jgi:hypothetical protein